MRRALRLSGFVLRFVIIGLAFAFLLNVFAPDIVLRLRGNPAPIAQQAPAPESPARPLGPVSYADAVTRAAPAVVNIYADKTTTVPRYRIVPDPLTQRLFGAIVAGPGYKKREQSLGSGVVFSTDGYVLTNNHVISGADNIQVLLHDGRVAEAKVIGSDADTDLAVLKIDAGDLPIIAVVNRGAVEVGDVVLAIGNPFGIGKTVTMGIVSATGRQLRLSAYEDFIQTDAAINSGNSGGALVNALGELIGINTAIYRNAGSSDGRSGPSNAEGIGFAIPVATAKAVLEQIIEHGHVIRGWLGAEYIDVPVSVGNIPLQHGVMVTEIYAAGPSALAGLRRGDILLKLDGNDITSHAGLRSREAALAPGTRVRIDGVRDGSAFTTEMALMQRPTVQPTGNATGN